MTSTISSEKQLRKLELLEQIKLLENEGDERSNLNLNLPSKTLFLNEPQPELPEVIEEEGTIEKPKKVKRVVKPRTEKQIESLTKGRLKMAQNQEEKRKIKEQENIIHKQELEKKLIEKAIKVKKKQLKKIEIFDDLSDEDTTPAIQKPKQEKPKAIAPTPPPPLANPYDEFKKKFNIR
jgi:hypothetical protein